MKCDVERCPAKEDGAEALRQMCLYCTRNKEAKEQVRDYSTAVQEGGY